MTQMIETLESRNLFSATLPGADTVAPRERLARHDGRDGGAEPPGQRGLAARDVGRGQTAERERQPEQKHGAAPSTHAG